MHRVTAQPIASRLPLLAALTLAELSFSGCSKPPPELDRGPSLGHNTAPASLTISPSDNLNRWRGYKRSLDAPLDPHRIIRSISTSKKIYVGMWSSIGQLPEEQLTLSRLYSMEMLNHALVSGEHFLKGVRKIGEAVANFQRLHPVNGTDIYHNAHIHTQMILHSKQGEAPILSILKEHLGTSDTHCVVSACVMTAAIANLLPSSELRSRPEVTVGVALGLYHGPQVPNGAGHAWVRILEGHANASISQVFVDSVEGAERPHRFDLNSPDYTAIASTSFTIIPRTGAITRRSQQILLIPPELSDPTISPR